MVYVARPGRGFRRLGEGRQSRLGLARCARRPIAAWKTTRSAPAPITAPAGLSHVTRFRQTAHPLTRLHRGRAGGGASAFNPDLNGATQGRRRLLPDHHAQRFPPLIGARLSLACAVAAELGGAHGRADHAHRVRGQARGRCRLSLWQAHRSKSRARAKSFSPSARDQHAAIAAAFRHRSGRVAEGARYRCRAGQSDGRAQPAGPSLLRPCLSRPAAQPEQRSLSLAWKAARGLRYVLTRGGPLSLSVNQGGGFFRTRPELDAAGHAALFLAADL